MKKITFNILVILLFIVGICFYFVKVKGYWINIPDTKIYSVKGIDISHHQGDIGFDLIDKSEFDFVYIKATEGGDFKDKKFLQNIKKFKELNIPVGAYHFFTLCKDGKTQAENFLDSIQSISIDLPPVIDLEFPGNCSLRPSVEDFSFQLIEFIKSVEKFSSKEIIFYTNEEFYYKYLSNNFTNRKYWYRNIFDSPEKFPSKTIIWQYSEFGKIKGIKGNVDLNVVKLDDWKNLLK